MTLANQESFDMGLEALHAASDSLGEANGRLAEVEGGKLGPGRSSHAELRLALDVIRHVRELLDALHDRLIGKQSAP